MPLDKMWKSYPEYAMTPDEWIEKINNRSTGPGFMYSINRALRRAGRDKIITREEQKSLWEMIKSSDEDCYVALKALETKYQKHEQ